MPTTYRRTAAPRAVTVDLETVYEQLQELTTRVEELAAQLASSSARDDATRPKMLKDGDIKAGDHLFTKITGHVTEVEVLEVIPMSGGLRYRIRRIDSGREMNTPRPAVAFSRTSPP